MPPASSKAAICKGGLDKSIKSYIENINLLPSKLSKFYSKSVVSEFFIVVLFFFSKINFLTNNYIF